MRGPGRALSRCTALIPDVKGFVVPAAHRRPLYKARLTPGRGFGGGGAGGSFLGPAGRGEEARSPAGTCERLWAGEGVPEAQEQLSAGMMGQT